MMNADLVNANLVNIDNACFGYSTLPTTALPVKVLPVNQLAAAPQQLYRVVSNFAGDRDFSPAVDDMFRDIEIIK